MYLLFARHYQRYKLIAIYDVTLDRSQTVTLYLVFLLICSERLMIDIDRNIRNYKEIKNRFARRSSVYLYT
jgi:hypothetical protein